MFQADVSRETDVSKTKEYVIRIKYRVSRKVGKGLWTLRICAGIIEKKNLDEH